ncbi:hypothetical protein Ahy_B08g091885 isoform C [Arachis hypogaea]|uniref:Uncharacterized protein n=1 Tax=Arachis hypogaea TaxID=3818 RepID=A0A444Y2U1_ARAHY|nr:hypothetical protein Ahy_B08g091885 isoform C [Arachis hypogaea]
MLHHVSSANRMYKCSFHLVRLMVIQVEKYVSTRDNRHNFGHASTFDTLTVRFVQSRDKKKRIT